MDFAGRSRHAQRRCIIRGGRGCQRRGAEGAAEELGRVSASAVGTRAAVPRQGLERDRAGEVVLGNETDLRWQ